MDAVAAQLARVPWPEVPHGEQGLVETIWLLLTSVIAVPLICKLPGGSPVLGFLVRPRCIKEDLTGCTLIPVAGTIDDMNWHVLERMGSRLLVAQG